MRCQGGPEAPTANEVSLSLSALTLQVSALESGPAYEAAIHQWRGTQCLDRGLENTGTIRTTSALRDQGLTFLSLKMRKSRPKGKSRFHSD